MQRTLVILSFIQLALIGFLTHQWIDTRAQLEQLALQTPAPLKSEHARDTSPERDGASPQYIGASAPALTEAQVRAAVRDEVKAALAVLSNHQAMVPASTEPDPDRALEQQYLAEALNAELDYFIDLGEINNTEMAALQSDLARLDPQSRTAMLKRMTRAMNAGELNARL